MDMKLALFALALSLAGDSPAECIKPKQDSATEWANEQKSQNFLSYKNNKLSITDTSGKELYSEKINLPEEVTLEVLAGKYLKLSSKKEIAIMETVKSNYVLIKAEPFKGLLTVNYTQFGEKGNLAGVRSGTTLEGAITNLLNPQESYDFRFSLPVEKERH